MKRMLEQDMLYQLYDLIKDRKSFLSESNNDSSKIFQNDINALEQIIHDYKLLRDFIYKSIEEKGDNLCIWINENVKSRKVDILNFWKTDYGDVRCNANLYKNKKQVANIIVSCDNKTIEEFIQKTFHTKECNDSFINATFKNLIYETFDTYLNLPKVSKCSNLLKEVYDTVCESESSMCHITDDEWNEDYADRFNKNDIENLKQELKKYRLEDVITINEDGYKIVGYGDLETRFNDDRKISKFMEYEK